jgi:DNA polymerase III gamma/tau subunit
MVFTPEHPYYPPYLHYSVDVVQYALDQAHHWTRSAENIADQLLTDHNVEVDPKTIQDWINTYSEQFFQTYFLKNPKTAVQDFRAITLDGTHFTSGKDLIGKKKVADSLSVTKLADEVYLVTWWE